MIMVEYQSDMDIVFRDIDLLKCRTFGVVHRYGAPVLLKQCVVLRACSSVLPIVKFWGSTLRRRRPLLPGSCSLSYTGKFLFYFFTHFRYSCCLWGLASTIWWRSQPMTTTTMMMTTMKKLLVIDIAHSIFFNHLLLHVVKLNYDVMPNGPQSEL